MLVRLVTADDFYKAFPSPATAYESQAFIHLNAHKVQAVRRFIGYDEHEKPRLGITLGWNGEQWRAPFSAPFSMPACNQPQSPERIYDFFTELADTLQAPLELTLPPALYAPRLILPYEVVLGNMAQRQWTDYNYHYPLEQAPRYAQFLDRSARNHCYQALKAPFDFYIDAPLERAYAVIAANRESHGYALAMSIEQVRATIAPSGPIDARCFLLTIEDKDVAAALVYDVVPGIAQVIYWGDAPGYSQLRPMNLLPMYLFEYYHDMHYSLIDIGPASQRGVPFSGLCRFKASIGCQLTGKHTYIL